MNKLKVSPSNKENRSTTPLGTDRLSALHSTSQYLPKNKSKEVSLLQSQLNALEKQHERLKQAHQHSMSEYAKLSQENTALRKEAEVQRQALSRQGKQKSDLDKALAEVKSYSRKLEAKIASGFKGNQIAHLQNSLEEQLADLKRENADQAEYIATLESENQRLSSDLSKALEVVELKAEEFGLTGDLKSSVLYQYTENKRALHSALADNASQATVLAQLQSQLQTALTNVEELKLIREANNDELTELEASVIRLNGERVELLGAINKLSDEKVQLLGTIEELHAELCGLQERDQGSQCTECDQLREQLRNVETDLEDLSAELTDQRSQNNALQEQLRILQIEQISLRNQLQLAETRKLALESQLDSVRTPKSLNSPFKPSTPLRPSTPVLSARRSPSSSDPNLQAQVEQTLEDIEALVGERELLTQVFRLSESNSHKRITPRRPQVRLELEDTPEN